MEDPRLPRAVRQGDRLPTIVEGHLAIRFLPWTPLADHGEEAVFVRERTHGLHTAPRRLATLQRDLHEVGEVDEALRGVFAGPRVTGLGRLPRWIIHQPGRATRLTECKTLLVHEREHTLPIAKGGPHLRDASVGLRQTLALLRLVESASVVADEARGLAREDVHLPPRALRVLLRWHESHSRVALRAIGVHPREGRTILRRGTVDGDCRAA
mmetsp:Transcript_2471/g.6213  ORF Transcript_2471/g.6213 Transcript_2471/m.6213 type:complete len:212 (+) Transcript_2471:916-1551(+)